MQGYHKDTVPLTASSIQKLACCGCRKATDVSLFHQYKIELDFFDHGKNSSDFQ